MLCVDMSEVLMEICVNAFWTVGLKCLSEAFYRQNLRHRPLKPIDDLLVVEADGTQVPYTGCIKPEPLC